MRIILAEDQAIERRILAARLHKSGYEVEEFPDGQAAWEQFGRLSARLVVTDRMMPRRRPGTHPPDSRRRRRQPHLRDPVDRADRKNDVFSGFAAGVDDYVTNPSTTVNSPPALPSAGA